MRINCPSCKATYEVPDALLGAAARKVRCARCAQEWIPETAPAAPVPVVPVPATPEPEPPTVRPAATRALPVPRVDIDPPTSLRRPAPEPSGVLGQVAVVALSVVALVALGCAAYVWRAQMMQVWPPSQRLFAAFGLA